jgi:hypothetical protein
VSGHEIRPGHIRGPRRLVRRRQRDLEAQRAETSTARGGGFPQPRVKGPNRARKA